MKNIQVLDCTLRDGGRIINCEFSDTEISNIVNELTQSNIDIIEVGFLRDSQIVNYCGNSTFFTNERQIEPFIPKKKEKSIYVAFIDFNMYTFSNLKKCNGKSITGIRVGFTKKQFDTQYDELRAALMTVKENGYKLFIQAVNVLSYSDKDILKLIDLVNDIQPYSCGIVDTYGAMYMDDIVHFYNLIDYNLDENIFIDIHSHNNFQLSFAFAQEVIKLSSGKRNIILDSTLDGMGKCAGNLNTELIVDYLNRKKQYNYDFDRILDIIDNYIYAIKQKRSWGYSVPAFMAGIYKSHPNNIIYLTEKFRINTKDIKNIISMIDPEKRQRYDYDNIEKLYIKYGSSNLSDLEAIKILKNKIRNKPVLVLVPGISLLKEKQKIRSFIENTYPVIISVNFISDYKESLVFWGNIKRYESVNHDTMEDNEIICSNIKKPLNKLCTVDYNLLINRGYKYFDNSTIMLLNLLKRIEVKEIYIAGFDGFDINIKNNFIDESFDNDRYLNEFENINNELEQMIREYYLSIRNKIKLSFLTSSRFDKIIGESND